MRSRTRSGCPLIGRFRDALETDYARLIPGAWGTQEGHRRRGFWDTAAGGRHGPAYAQLADLRAYAERRGAQPLVYVDRGISGARDRRPALDELMGAVRRREADAVVVTKLDRVARSVRHLTALAAELEALGVDLLVLDQSIDTGTPSGRLLFHVLGAIAEFERDLIRERTRAGLAAARRRGRSTHAPGPESTACSRAVTASGPSPGCWV